MLDLTPEEVDHRDHAQRGGGRGPLRDRGARSPRAVRPTSVIVDAPSYVDVPYRLGTNLVRDVIRGGAIVVRDGRRVPA